MSEIILDEDLFSLLDKVATYTGDDIVAYVRSLVDVNAQQYGEFLSYYGLEDVSDISKRLQLASRKKKLVSLLETMPAINVEKVPDTIEAASILVRTGITKSTLRHWVSRDLLLKQGGNRLTITDKFPTHSLIIRIPFIIANAEIFSELPSIFRKELGEQDDLLKKIVLTDQAYFDLVREISSKHALRYDFKVLEAFRL